MFVSGLGIAQAHTTSKYSNNFKNGYNDIFHFGILQNNAFDSLEINLPSPTRYDVICPPPPTTSKNPDSCMTATSPRWKM